MWFKQAQFFKLDHSIDTDTLEDDLEKLSFTPCLTGLPLSQGWIPPADEEDTSMVYEVQGFLLICLQTEAKLIPAKIVRQKLNETIKKLQSTQDRKLSSKEKFNLKQEIYNKLLPQAFSVLYRDYALIDTKNNWLILNTNSLKYTENFINFFKRSVNKIKLISPEIKKVSPILTKWLDQHPKTFAIEDACVLQNPKNPEKIIRIQRQDLSANYLQALLKNNFEVYQIKITWNDQITCVLKNDFTLQSIQYHDSVIETADKSDAEENSFRADFFIMSGVLTKMFQDLLKLFAKDK